MAKDDVRVDPVLSSEEMAALEKRAAQEVEAEMKAELAKNFLDERKKELKKKSLFAHGKDAKGKDTVQITLDLAPNSAYIMLDGRTFYHGHRYRFTQEQAAVITEQAHRGWMHEAEIHGLDMNSVNGRRQANIHLAGEA